MSNRQHGSGRERFVHQENTSSDDLSWRREPVAKDHTTIHPTAVGPTASSIVTLPEARHPYRVGAQGSPQYNSTPHVYPPYDYGALGLTYPGSRAHYPPYPGSRAHYPPYPGSRAHYPPYPGSRAHYPRHGVGASGPPYGVRGPGHASYSHGLAAHDLPSHEPGAIAPSPKFPAVSLSGLPNDCREADIIQFFDGLHILHIFLVFINKKFSGKAVVVFSNSTVADYALQRNKQKLGNKLVEISTCKIEEYYDAVAAKVNDGVDFGDPRAHAKSSYNHHESPQDQATRPHKRRSDAVGDGKLHGHSEVEPENILDKGHAKQTRHILKVHGLASLADKKAVIGVFGDCNLSEDMVHNVIHPDGNPTGEIFLEFISEEDAKKAMSKNKTMIGSDLIEIIPSTLEDLPIKNTKRRKESGCHDRVKDSNDKEFMGPDGHSHGKPKRSNDKEKSVHPTASSIVTVPEARHPYRFGAQGSPQYNSAAHVYPPYDYGAYVQDTCSDKSVADVSPNIPGRCHYVLAIENMEKDLSTSTVTKFIHKETTILPEAHIFPSLKTDLFTRGILKVHTEREFEKLLEFLENPNHIIVSSHNRPWVVTEMLSGEDYMGTTMEHCNGMESNSELKVICSGTDEYLVSKKHKENYTEFNRHHKLVLRRLAFEEEKISRQFGK
ncbi:unnamed protein product [Rhodiola kirilowii]